MATFSAQVVDLVGAFSDETALDSFITEGANEVINAMPRAVMERVAEETTVSDGTTTSEGHKILHVLRNDGTIDQPCRLVLASKRGRIQDSSDMEFATTSDPAYYIQDGKINIFPNGNGKMASVPTYSQASPLDASGISTITNFPNEYEYLVTLYAAVKALQQNMTTKHGNSDITTAIGNMKQAIINAGTEIGLAKGEAAGIPTATDQFRAATGDPVIFGAEVQYDTDAGLKKVDTALNAAITYINDNQFSADYDLAANFADIDAELTSEDVELANARMSQAQTTMNAIQSQINLAQAHIAEWNAAIGGLTAEVASFTAGIQGYVGTANSFLSQAQSDANEIQTRLAIDTTEYSWYEKQQAKLQSDYDRGIQIMRGA